MNLSKNTFIDFKTIFFSPQVKPRKYIEIIEDTTQVQHIKKHLNKELGIINDTHDGSMIETNVTGTIFKTTSVK